MAYRNTERNFESWLKQSTSHPIRMAIMAHLDAYREDEQVFQDEDWGEGVLRASNQQQQIGENSFVEGFVGTEWEGVQERYLEQIGSKKTPHDG